ncbi:MAG: hypothetical protein LBG28_11665 [Tannerella sp.]|jgi:hypothetical protein|nr:hypothetical protein [Tannerella sp.]
MKRLCQKPEIVVTSEGEARSNPLIYCYSGLLHFVRDDGKAAFDTAFFIDDAPCIIIFMTVNLSVDHAKTQLSK